MSANMQVISSLSAGWWWWWWRWFWLLVSLAAFEELGQHVPQLRQLEDLAVQQLQQRAQALVKGFPFPLAAVQTLLQIAQLGLQRLVPRLCVLKQTTRIRRFKFKLSNHFLSNEVKQVKDRFLSFNYSEVFLVRLTMDMKKKVKGLKLMQQNQSSTKGPSYPTNKPCPLLLDLFTQRLRNIAALMTLLYDGFVYWHWT